MSKNEVSPKAPQDETHGARKVPGVVHRVHQPKQSMIWQLKLIGVHAKKYKALQDALQQAMAKLKGIAVVEQVTDIDSIIASKVSATPALVLEDEVLVENSVPDVHKLTEILKAAMASKKRYMSTKRILVPVDFSDASRNALVYALHWAQTHGLRVEVVHTFSSHMADPSQPYFIPVQEEEQAAVNQRLKAFVQETLAHTPFASVEVKWRAIAGYPVEMITELSKDEDVALIIMATTGEHDLLEQVFGSVSTVVSQRAWAPVLLVPKGIRFQPYKHILYATNLEATDKQMVQQVIELARFFRANVHFVHVVEDTTQAVAVEEAVFEQVFSQAHVPEVAFNLVGIRADKPWEAISEYAQSHHIDLLITVTRHRSFWERLMHKSVTKRLALGTQIPMLVLHLDSQKEENGIWLPKRSTQNSS